MKNAVGNAMGLMLLPSLLTTYVVTGVVGVYYLFATIVILSFLVALLNLTTTTRMLKIASPEDKRRIAWAARRPSILRWFNVLFQLATIFALFWYSKYFIGGVFLITFLLFSGAREALKTADKGPTIGIPK